MDRVISQQRFSLCQYIETKYNVETARLVRRDIKGTSEAGTLQEQPSG